MDSSSGRRFYFRRSIERNSNVGQPQWDVPGDGVPRALPAHLAELGLNFCLLHDESVAILLEALSASRGERGLPVSIVVPSRPWCGLRAAQPCRRGLIAPCFAASPPAVLRIGGNRIQARAISALASLLARGGVHKLDLKTNLASCAPGLNEEGGKWLRPLADALQGQSPRSDSRRGFSQAGLFVRSSNAAASATAHLILSV